MQKNLVIVESPAKAKTIEKFLGKDYKVLSSYGHIRDLKKKEFSIDIDKDFKPHYEIPGDKKKVVEELKAEAKEAETVWLASDEDREGEAIAWHLTATGAYQAYRFPRNHPKRHSESHRATAQYRHQSGRCPTGAPYSGPYRRF